MLFIGFSVVLITMAAMKVDADSCKEMPRMFKKKKACVRSKAGLHIPVELGGKSAVSCRESLAP